MILGSAIMDLSTFLQKNPKKGITEVFELFSFCLKGKNENDWGSASKIYIGKTTWSLKYSKQFHNSKIEAKL